MKTVLRAAALFLTYGAIGFGGDYAVGLFARDAAAEVPRNASEVHVKAEVDVEPRVAVRVDPAIVARAVRHVGACDYGMTHELTVPGNGVTDLDIDVGAGELRVEGRADLQDIVIVGLVCASHEAFLDELRLTTEVSGERLFLEAHYPQDRERFDGDRTARIDVTVLIPAGLAVSVDDSSGDIEVIASGDLTIDDSSGSIRVTDVLGSVRIDDSSGDVHLERVGGDVDVEDGSGGVWIGDVEGSVAVSDGSGGIEVRGARGDFLVRRDGSGGIDYTGIEGRVDVPERKRRGRR